MFQVPWLLLYEVWNASNFEANKSHHFFYLVVSEMQCIFSTITKNIGFENILHANKMVEGQWLWCSSVKTIWKGSTGISDQTVTKKRAYLSHPALPPTTPTTVPGQNRFKNLHWIPVHTLHLHHLWPMSKMAAITWKLLLYHLYMRAKNMLQMGTLH